MCINDCRQGKEWSGVAIVPKPVKDRGQIQLAIDWKQFYWGMACAQLLHSECSCPLGEIFGCHVNIHPLILTDLGRDKIYKSKKKKVQTCSIYPQYQHFVRMVVSVGTLVDVMTWRATPSSELLHPFWCKLCQIRPWNYRTGTEKRKIHYFAREQSLCLILN